MDEVHMIQHLHRKVLHAKRPFKHGVGLAVDSPLYDASEEDNDEFGDDTSSVSAVPSAVEQRPATTTSSPLGPGPNHNGRSTAPTTTAATTGHPNKMLRSMGPTKTQGAAQPSDSEALDSPTYDGDIESSTTAAAGQTSRNPHPHAHVLSTSTFAEETPQSGYFLTASESGTSTASSLVGGVSSNIPTDPSNTVQAKMTEPASSIATTPSEPAIIPAIDMSSPQKAGAFIGVDSGGNAMNASKNVHAGHPDHALAEGEPVPADPSIESIDPSALTPDDIQAYVQAAIRGTGPIQRNYNPNPPPQGRPIRVYADGVYDIFHFGHALQLRQAKLSFPAVHLIVGVCSDNLCTEHKSRTVMTHAERCESVRHCRWVDEIVSDAPWVIDQAFLDKHQIDYVAHDEDPYKGSDGSEDVYHYVKSTGHFIPTRRTPGVSTSELLERIVAGYREGDWDAKLVKIGHPELASRAPSRAASRPQSRMDGGLLAVAPKEGSGA